MKSDIIRIVLGLIHIGLAIVIFRVEDKIWHLLPVFMLSMGLGVYYLTRGVIAVARRWPLKR